MNIQSGVRRKISSKTNEQKSYERKFSTPKQVRNELRNVAACTATGAGTRGGGESSEMRLRT